ncbi:Golgi-associated plant pathogenesis-related protein 1 [Esox lucius]|uniref:Golgi-associated plant pathogenesis-related protein 1 n=1 Tax=Esox lucius TaxID=8010 RepID=UPI001476A447|nr:Golgi-associated plant pathogenesis-related protein 1 [Esox lucius]
MAGASFEQEFLDTHNAYRKKHGSSPMTLSRDFCNSARKWAEHLVAIQNVVHSNGEIGENIFCATSTPPQTLTGKEAVDSWYSEVKDYNDSNPGFDLKTGNFTQVVWEESTELGVGLGIDGGTVYVVGHYKPSGNKSVRKTLWHLDKSLGTFAKPPALCN